MGRRNIATGALRIRSFEMCFYSCVDVSSYQNEVSIVINRTPQDLYEMVADVSNMARWSPVCTGAKYDGDGEWFTGANEMSGSTWETRCRVVAAEPGREFTFINHGFEGRVEAVRWSFQFQPVDRGATEVTQTWRVLPTYAECLGIDEESAIPILDAMKQAALSGMPATLDALKRDAESD